MLCLELSDADQPHKLSALDERDAEVILVACAVPAPEKLPPRRHRGRVTGGPEEEPRARETRREPKANHHGEIEP